MAIKDVTALRKAGNLQGAYNLAKHELEENRNEWTQMSMFWVLRDICISYINGNNLIKAKTCLKEMSGLLPGMIDDSGAGHTSYEKLVKQLTPGYEEVKTATELSKTNPIDAYERIVTEFGNDGARLDETLHEDFGWIIYRYIRKRIEELTSFEVRSLMRDYMNLKNERPSLLHSMILTFALNFAKENQDFKFINFLQLWGLKNLRYEDLHNGFLDGKDIPSLISRICRFIAESDLDFDIYELSESTGKAINDYIDYFRQPIFWQLMNSSKKERKEILWGSFANYNTKYSKYGPSHWHSEILKLATRLTQDNSENIKYFEFVKNWDITNFSEDDWIAEKGDDGKEYPSLAVKVVKACFDIYKSNSQVFNTDDIEWLISFYDKVQKRCHEDEWIARQRAMLSLWNNNKEDAINRYKRLLVDLSDKYYVWLELATCVESPDIKLGLLLKAKSLETNEDFLGSIHLELARVLIKLHYFMQAENDLNAYVSHKNLRGYQISSEYSKLAHVLNGLKHNVPQNENPFRPQAFIHVAEDFVYSEYEWIEFVIVDKYLKDNQEFVRLTDGDKRNLNIKSKKFTFLRKAKVGSVVKFRCAISETTKKEFRAYSCVDIKNETIKPLVGEVLDSPLWGILTSSYGYIEYINNAKGVLHIITQNSKAVFCSMTNGETFESGDFVKFKHYNRLRKDKETGKEEECIEIVAIERCDRNEAIPNFKKRIVVVDDVNEKKQLFHVVLGKGLVSDIIRYSDTKLRPSVGDFLEVVYVIRRDKNDKKRIKFLDVQTSNQTDSNLRNSTSGQLTLKFDDWEEEKPLFGFVNDIYVSKDILQKHAISEDCMIEAKIVLTGDGKWKAYDITPI